MTVVRGYRLVKRKWLKTAFDGEGARLYGGRWNSKGKACVYLASTESLAMLEVMVHLEDNQLLKEYALLEVTFREEVLMQLPEDVLPADWRAEPAPPSTAEIGDTARPRAKIATRRQGAMTKNNMAAGPSGTTSDEQHP